MRPQYTATAVRLTSDTAKAEMALGTSQLTSTSAVNNYINRLFTKKLVAHKKNTKKQTGPRLWSECVCVVTLTVCVHSETNGCQ